MDGCRDDVCRGRDREPLVPPQLIPVGKREQGPKPGDSISSLGFGQPLEFFGERTTLPAGPATLALRSGAPILPTAVYFTDRTDGHLGIVRPPVAAERTDAGLRADVVRVTQSLATDLEHLIRRAPHQWHLFQPNWPSDPGYA